MSTPPYSIHTDIKFPPLELIDIGKLQEATQDQWFNQTLCKVNDCVVRLGVLQGEFHWHKHDHKDEFFYVVDASSSSTSKAAPSSSPRSRASPSPRASSTAPAPPFAPSSS
jgi:hypothetical protein